MAKNGASPSIDLSRRRLERVAKESAKALGVELTKDSLDSLVSMFEDSDKDQDTTTYRPGLFFGAVGRCNILTGHIDIWLREVLEDVSRHYRYPTANGSEDYVEDASLRKLNETHFHEYMHKYGKTLHGFTKKGKESFERVARGEHDWLYGKEPKPVFDENGGIRYLRRTPDPRKQRYVIWRLS